MEKQYPVKVLVAWGEAISGNRELRDWLLGNGFPELGLFVHAMHNQQSAMTALVQDAALRFARSQVLTAAEPTSGTTRMAAARGFLNLGHTCYINAIVQ